MRAILMILFILSLVVICQTAIDLYLPSLPIMVSDLKSNPVMMQFSIPVFLIGCAVSQMIYGPCSDYVGRKPILMVGITIFICGTFICIFSHSIFILLLGRLTQGIGISAASTLSRALSRDIFHGVKLAKTFSYIAIAWSLVPMLAPILGSYIQYYSNWRFNFIFLAI